MVENNIHSPVMFDDTLINHRIRYFDVPGIPFAKQRPRATRKGAYITIYTPRETKNYEKRVSFFYNEEYRSDEPFDTSLSVEIEAIFPVPKSASKSISQQMLDGNIPHVKKPDCDNTGKICLDALNGIAYTDDAIINKLVISKKYGDTPKVRILIKENEEIEGDTD